MFFWVRGRHCYHSSMGKKIPHNYISNLTTFLFLLKIMLIAIFVNVLSTGNIIFIKKYSLLSGKICPEKIFFIKTFKSRISVEFCILHSTPELTVPGAGRLLDWSRASLWFLSFQPPWKYMYWAKSYQVGSMVKKILMIAKYERETKSSTLEQ